MQDFIVTYLPYFLGPLTLYQVYSLGKKQYSSWALNIFIQILWIVWNLLAGAYGFLILPVGLIILSIHNYNSWKPPVQVVRSKRK